jgi:hypothetical protein
MSQFRRLREETALTREQMQAINHIITKEGLCLCGRYLKPTDFKLCLAKAGIHGPDRGKLIIAGYCFGCANKINDVLNALGRDLTEIGSDGKPRPRHPEPDRLRHEGK